MLIREYDIPRANGALKEVCQACPSRAKCRPNTDARKIAHEEKRDARDVAGKIAKTDADVISMRLRKKVEMLFAQLKRILGFGCLRLRGPRAASDELLLATTAQNLRKLAKTFQLPPASAIPGSGGPFPSIRVTP